MIGHTWHSSIFALETLRVLAVLTGLNLTAHYELRATTYSLDMTLPTCLP